MSSVKSRQSCITRIGIRFSQNILDNPNITLWNVIIGAGSIGGASENTLVEVTIAGQPKSSAESLAVHVTAKTRTRTLLDRTSKVGVMNTNGRYYVLRWVLALRHGL